MKVQHMLWLPTLFYNKLFLCKRKRKKKKALSFHIRENASLHLAEQCRPMVGLQQLLDYRGCMWTLSSKHLYVREMRMWQLNRTFTFVLGPRLWQKHNNNKTCNKKCLEVLMDTAHVSMYRFEFMKETWSECHDTQQAGYEEEVALQCVILVSHTYVLESAVRKPSTQDRMMCVCECAFTVVYPVYTFHSLLYKSKMTEASIWALNSGSVTLTAAKYRQLRKITWNLASTSLQKTFRRNKRNSAVSAGVKQMPRYQLIISAVLWRKEEKGNAYECGKEEKEAISFSQAIFPS